MNKIDQINEAAASLAGSNIKNTKEKQTKAFENALDKALHKTNTESWNMQSANALHEIVSKDLNIIKSSDIVSGQTDQLLAMLDAYSNKLVDPNVSLKSIAPVLEEINNNADNLLKETQNLTDSDMNLRQIATHTIVTAQTEYLKFQRGDYNNF
ncbi:MAG: hypothetical protein GY857_01375 [Desulfobacula sp.]|nr:hypothetical protein [Desulfobacula sp.]